MRNNEHCTIYDSWMGYTHAHNSCVIDKQTSSMRIQCEKDIQTNLMDSIVVCFDVNATFIVNNQHTLLHICNLHSQLMNGKLWNIILFIDHWFHTFISMAHYRHHCSLCSPFTVNTFRSNRYWSMEPIELCGNGFSSHNWNSCESVFVCVKLMQTITVNRVFLGYVTYGSNEYTL